MALFPGKGTRKQINDSLYSKSRHGFYVELNDALHLAYADQRDGHGKPYWWRIFYGDRLRSIALKSVIVRVWVKSSV